MKTKRAIHRMVVLLLVVPAASAVANDVYWDDGGSYVINDNTHHHDLVYLDYNVANDPGTHVALVDGGFVGQLEAYNKATISMSGGWSDFIVCRGNSTMTVTGGLAGMRGYDTSTINIYDGANVTSAGARDYGHISIYGGNIAYVNASNNAAVNIYGGILTQSIGAYADSEINVYGYDLVLSPTGGTYGHGTLVGYLQDGSHINIDLGNSEAHLHINLIPEPSVLSLLVLGLLGLSRKKR